MRSLVLAIISGAKEPHLGIKTTYKPFVVPQKDTEHYFQAFKSYNIPELSENPLSFSAVKIRQVHEKVPAEPFK